MAAAANLRVELARESDDAAIRAMCRRQAMPGRVRVTFEREPEYSLGCRAAGEDCQILVARAAGNGEIAGVACRSARRVFVNGCEMRLGYLSQLRIAPRFQGRWLVSRGFRILREIQETDPLPAYLMAIVEGNREATGVLVQNRRRGFPAFHPVAEFRTLAISISSKRFAAPCDAAIARAEDRDAAEIAWFLCREGGRRHFFPAHSESSLRELAEFGLRIEDFFIARHEGEISGVMALWDQSAFKQTVVQSYSGWLGAAAAIYNWSAIWMRRTALPRPGEKLRSAYAAFACIANDDEAVFTSLFHEIRECARRRNVDFVLLGMDVRDSLFAAARRFKHIAYPSRLYLAEWPDGGIFYERLDDRPVYADIATL
ncbi:MAG TPA: hypothetical protein VJR23_16930 [Candidatus Acidoferrales bacterium]|nr:hypothetical protein [Candidatus Acidoferrales bacterium]